MDSLHDDTRARLADLTHFDRIEPHPVDVVAFHFCRVAELNQLPVSKFVGIWRIAHVSEVLDKQTVEK